MPAMLDLKQHEHPLNSRIVATPLRSAFLAAASSPDYDAAILLRAPADGYPEQEARKDAAQAINTIIKTSRGKREDTIALNKVSGAIPIKDDGTTELKYLPQDYMVLWPELSDMITTYHEAAKEPSVVVSAQMNFPGLSQKSGHDALICCWLSSGPAIRTGGKAVIADAGDWVYIKAGTEYALPESNRDRLTITLTPNT